MSRRLCRCGRALQFELKKCKTCLKAEERAKRFKARYERLNRKPGQ